MDENTTDPPKRKPGRPKGSKNKPKAAGNVVALPRAVKAIAKAVEKGEKEPPAAADMLKPNEDPLQFLLDVMNNGKVDPRLRVRAAVTACQYKHTRRADGGKREEAAAKAEKAATGRFAPPSGPPGMVQ